VHLQTGLQHLAYGGLFPSMSESSPYTPPQTSPPQPIRTLGPWLLWFLAAALGGLFIYAGLLKSVGLGPLTFLDDIRSFHMLGDPWAALLAIFLPMLEITCGVALIIGFCRRGALLLLLAMLIGFLIAIAITWVRGIDITCGCFGKQDGPSNHLDLIVRDVVLLAIAALLFWKESRIWRILPGKS
jgi:uncharacterized membrane protein YphA (DoxX/SURF4 family)